MTGSPTTPKPTSETDSSAAAAGPKPDPCDPARDGPSTSPGDSTAATSTESSLGVPANGGGDGVRSRLSRIRLGLIGLQPQLVHLPIERADAPGERFAVSKDEDATVGALPDVLRHRPSPLDRLLPLQDGGGGPVELHDQHVIPVVAAHSARTLPAQTLTINVIQ